MILSMLILPFEWHPLIQDLHYIFSPEMIYHLRDFFPMLLLSMQNKHPFKENRDL